MTIDNYSSEKALDDFILYLLYQHKGRENAIDRWSLVRRVYGDEAVPSHDEETDGNTYDRNVRDSIERWRPQGHFICNRGDGKGYYIATSREEYEEWKKYYLGSSYLKLKVVNILDSYADTTWGKVPKEPDPLPLFSEVRS